MDVHSKSVRSYNMSKIKSKNTKPEMLIQKFLKDLGFKVELHPSYIRGTPDIYLPEINLVIQVNGCFWHMHKNCEYFRLPKSNVSFWKKKLKKNVKRDKANRQCIEKDGFCFCCIWECEIRDCRCIEKILDYL